MAHLVPDEIRACAQEITGLGLSWADLSAGLDPGVRVSVSAEDPVDALHELNQRGDPAALREALVAAVWRAEQAQREPRESQRLRGAILKLPASGAGAEARAWAQRVSARRDELKERLRQLVKAQRLPAAGAALRDQIAELDRELLRGRPLAPGDLLSGRYELVSQSGHGGFGDVWMAMDRESNDEIVAVKVLRNELFRDATKLDLFRKGALTMRDLAQKVPGVLQVTVPDGLDDPYAFVVMPWFDDGTLNDLFDRPSTSVSACLEEVVRLCEVVAQVHARGSLHLDLQPRNVLLARDGRRALCDFELAVPLGVPHGTHQARPHLTRLYAAPEIERGEAPTAAADIYSLGRLALRAWMGRWFELGRTIPEDLSGLELPTRLHEVLRKATARDPGERHPSAAALAVAMAATLSPDEDPLDRWLAALQLPDAVQTRGPRAARQIAEILVSLGDGEQIARLFQRLGYEAAPWSDDMSADEVSYQAAEHLERRLSRLLEFWAALERHSWVGDALRGPSWRADVPVGAPALSPKDPDGADDPVRSALAARAQARALAYGTLLLLPPWRLRFLALVALPSHRATGLPSWRDTPAELSMEVATALVDVGALGRMAELVAATDPVVAQRLREAHWVGSPVEPISGDAEAGAALLGVLGQVPARGAHGWWAERAPPGLRGLVSPRWPEERARLACAELAWRARLLGAGPPVVEPVDDPMLGPLRGLIAAMFSSVELDLLAHRFDRGKAEVFIPFRGSNGELARAFVDHAAISGVLATFLACLLELRPAWRAEIHRVGARLDLDAAAIADAPPPRPSRSLALAERLLGRCPDGILPARLVPAELTRRIPAGGAPPVVRLLQTVEELRRRALLTPDWADQIVAFAPELSDAVDPMLDSL